MKKPYSLLQLSDDFPSKNMQKMDKPAGMASGLNKWYFSLRKSKNNDLSRKHFEEWKGSSDPNRVIWAQVNEARSHKKIALKKSIGTT